jgi:uncharacterized protein YjbI with pentapeptide repeats
VSEIKQPAPQHPRPVVAHVIGPLPSRFAPWHRENGRRFAVSLVVVLISAASLTMSAVPAGAAPECTPGSGTNLEGQRLEGTQTSAGQTLQCANLSGADLSGADLSQQDLSGVLAPNANFSNADLGQAHLAGAVLTGADFTGAKLGQTDLTGAKLAGAKLAGVDLGQVTLTDADLSGADLRNAKFVQADAKGLNLTGANAAGADFSQATLSNAMFTNATVTGADFTQAGLDGAHFDGVKGLVPWSTYLLIGAVVIFLVLTVSSVALVLRRGSGRPTPNQPYGELGGAYSMNAPAGRGAGLSIALAVLGSFLVALGAHLFVGGLMGDFSFASDTLATKVCTQPQCVVGINSGMAGTTGGIFVVIAGFALIGGSSRFFRRAGF